MESRFSFLPHLPGRAGSIVVGFEVIGSGSTAQLLVALQQEAAAAQTALGKLFPLDAGYFRVFAKGNPGSHPQLQPARPTREALPGGRCSQTDFRGNRQRFPTIKVGVGWWLQVLSGGDQILSLSVSSGRAHCIRLLKRPPTTPGCTQGLGSPGSFPSLSTLFQPSVTARPLGSALRVTSTPCPAVAATPETSRPGAGPRGGRWYRSSVCSPSCRNCCR